MLVRRIPKEEDWGVLEFFGMKIFHDDLSLWLDLEKFESEADKFCRASVGVLSSDVL
jgi:hypothetical protein